MPIILPGDPYSGSGHPFPGIQPPPIDTSVHPYPTTPTTPPSSGWSSGINNYFGNVNRSIQPVGTAASIYQSNTGPNAQQLDLRRRLVQSGRGIINLSNPMSPSNLAVWNAEEGVYGANQGVLDATGRQNTASRAVNANELQNIGMQQGNFERILAASNDVADKSAVAQYNEYLAGRDRRNRMFGVDPEQRIDVSNNPGYQLPSGQIAAPVSNEAKVTREAGVQEKRAGFLSEILRNKAGAAGLDVNDARLTSSRASANASHLKSLASRELDQAKYDDSLLGNDYEMSKLPPFPGAVMWEDPETGGSEWVTANAKSNLQYTYANKVEDQRMATEISRQQSQQEQAARAQTQRTTGGSPMGALSEAGVLNQLTAFDPGSFATVRAELIRRYTGPPHYYNQQQAELAADNAIAAEMGGRAPHTTTASTAPPAPPTPQPRSR